jgi:hypothetical protein
MQGAGKNTSIESFLGFLQSRIDKDFPKDKPKLLITETGVLITNGVKMKMSQSNMADKNTRTGTLNYQLTSLNGKAALQYAAGSDFMTIGLVAKDGSSNGRISGALYYGGYGSVNRWDSGLFDWKGARRPVLCGIEGRKMKNGSPSLSGCNSKNGNVVSAQRTVTRCPRDTEGALLMSMPDSVLTNKMAVNPLDKANTLDDWSADENAGMAISKSPTGTRSC